MKRSIRVPLYAVLIAFAAAVGVLWPAGAGSDPSGPANNVLARQLQIEQGKIQPTKFDKPVSGSVMQAVDQSFDGGAGGSVAVKMSGKTLAYGGRQQAVPVPPSQSKGTNGCPNRFKGDNNDNENDGGRIDNIRVNQDCSLRRQAEEWVGVNPVDFSNVLAGQNDSIIGFNHCGYDWSLNRGREWGSVGTQPPPFWQTILQDGHTSDACSDPAATFDHLGNAYVTGVIFDINSPANGIFVAKSNYPIKGRFYHSPKPDPYQEYRTSPLGKVASDISPDIFHDKELMVADTRSSSPKKGRVYVTWTRFETNATVAGGRSPIVFSQSTDGGATWSPAVIISGAAGAFCTASSGTADNPNACDQDQGSDPYVGPDGTIYVIFGNGNTPEAGQNQVLMVKCPAANNCATSAGWLGPFRIGDLVGTHPIGNPGNPGGCPTGRQCLPPNGYRVPEFTSLTISVDKNSNLYATWADYRNGRPPCTPLSLWTTASPPCDNDVFYAYSTTGGVTWSPTINVTPRSRLGENAQWQPWSDVMGDGSRVQVAFYDRHYGDCEFTGCNDITLATISNPRSANPTIKYRRITTSSMPNLIPANNPVQAGFLGDYMWLEVGRHNFDQRATHIVWADTRPLFGSAPEEDIYYAKVGPDGEDQDDEGNGGGGGDK
ncbi:MAG: hypothetical protein ABI927_08610 [Gaiellaceae bacterium]